MKPIQLPLGVRLRDDATFANYYPGANAAALGYVERYWVSVSSGLLAAAERECDGAVVYRMAALTVSYDGVDAEDFTLPNGTVLYEPAVAATKEISEND